VQPSGGLDSAIIRGWVLVAPMFETKAVEQQLQSGRDEPQGTSHLQPIDRAPVTHRQLTNHCVEHLAHSYGRDLAGLVKEALTLRCRRRPVKLWPLRVCGRGPVEQKRLGSMSK